MRIVIVTAEPRGAYHLHALHRAMAASGHAFVHLIPYDETVQGTAWTTTTADLSVLDGADRLVVTGGSYSAWTQAVAWYAAERGVPIRFSELAFVPTDPAGMTLPPLAAVSSIARSGAEALGTYLGWDADAVVITGNPQLDALSARAADPQEVLIVSTDLPAVTDPDGELMRLARRLRDEGHPVIVGTHPREDTRTWEGFTLAAPSTVAAAAHARVAVGYLGSAAPMILATGCPFVALDPVGERANLPSRHRQATSAWVRTADEAYAALLDPAPVPDDLIAAVTGPIGHAAERVVDFWTGPDASSGTSTSSS